MTTVAALMPTLPGRDELRQRAIESYQRQIYPLFWRVRLYQDTDPEPTLGAKLNRMIAAACDEDYIVLIDDDDWHSPTRVFRQVAPLLQGYELTGTSKIYYQDGKEAWLYSGDGSWLGGMAFTRAAWNRLPFEDVSIGCDTRWQRTLQPKSLDLADPALFVATVHSGNTSPKRVFSGPCWKKVDFTKVIRETMNA